MKDSNSIENCFSKSGVQQPRQDRGHPSVFPRLRDHRPLQGRHLRLVAGLQQTHSAAEG